MAQILIHSAKLRRPRVGLDCLCLPANFSGAAIYICELTRALLKADRPFAVTVFCKPTHLSLFENAAQPGDAILCRPIHHKPHLLWFYEYQLPRLLLESKVDLFHAMHYLTPPATPSYRLLTNVFDLGFLLHPAQYPAIKQAYFHWRMPHFLQRADGILTISKATQQDVARIFPEFPAKIEAVYPGLDHLGNFSTNPMACPGMLAVNTLEKRKNIPFLIEVYNYLRRDPLFKLPFYIVGHRANGYEAVQAARERSPFRDDIHILTSVATVDLPGFYRQAVFFANASGYEGFGFTPFEAIWHGCPIFCYKNAVLAEILGSSPYFLDHFQAAEWAHLILAEWRRGFPDRIPSACVMHLTWQTAAQNVIRIYQDLLAIKKPAA